MAHPDVESWRVEAPTRPCGFCRSTIEGRECTSCSRCGAVYHPDCWNSNSRRCAVYGCEPGQKPAVVVARPVRPPLQPPPLPRSGPSWTWVLPILAIFVAHAARTGLGGSSARPLVPPPTPPQVAWLDEESHGPEPVIPALPHERHALMSQADGLVKSVSALNSMPGGRLTNDIRALIRETVTAEVATLGNALKIYSRCAAAQSDEALRHRIEQTRWLLLRKRRLLLEVTRSMGPD